MGTAATSFARRERTGIPARSPVLQRAHLLVISDTQEMDPHIGVLPSNRSNGVLSPVSTTQELLVSQGWRWIQEQ
ncbi:hypothetical protein Y1Q_0010464 [Alligator mississippiensis]|uniref:Uncharacterized protein n=1 Tax=Alligator mississippiensis TaxID=8496 RepID=A0A151P6G2_ALLMI|nr:hypothetical protein Y1Q_0010464 [Alligator mississippiensis]